MEISYSATPQDLTAVVLDAVDLTDTSAVSIDTPVQAAVKAAWALVSDQTAPNYEIHVSSGDTWAVVRIAAVHKEA